MATTKKKTTPTKSKTPITERSSKASKEIKKEVEDKVKEPIKVESATVKTIRFKDSDMVEFVGNGLHPKLPARKPKKLQYATAKVLVGKGYGYIRELKEA